MLTDAALPPAAVSRRTSAEMLAAKPANLWDVCRGTTECPPAQQALCGGPHDSSPLAVAMADSPTAAGGGRPAMPPAEAAPVERAPRKRPRPSECGSEDTAGHLLKRVS